jgi:hypothetical protein
MPLLTELENIIGGLLATNRPPLTGLGEASGHHDGTLRRTSFFLFWSFSLRAAEATP